MLLLIYKNKYKFMLVTIKIDLLTVLFSCDRSKFLNISISSFYHHVQIYENKINIIFNFIDSGTKDRMIYVQKYNIKNYFFMNPNDPEYSYRVFWSYLHGEFVLFLEDDRPFIRNIEEIIYYPNFIEESILVLNSTNEVKGIILKRDGVGKIYKKEILTYLGKHVVCILIKPPQNYFYTNGPSIYKVKYLLQAGVFLSEYLMANKFQRLTWYTGFTYKGIHCNTTNIYTTNCQGVSYHFGKEYSTLNMTKRKVCRVALY